MASGWQQQARADPGFRAFLRDQGVKPPGSFGDLRNPRQRRLVNRYQQGAAAPPAGGGDAGGGTTPAATSPASPPSPSTPVPPLTPYATTPPASAGPTPPAGLDTSGWIYDPNSTYGGTVAGFETSPVGEKYLQDNPDAALARYAAELGIDPMSGRGGVARGLLSRLNTAYDAALADNPMLRRMDFLHGIDLQGVIQGMSASERGEQPGRYSGRARTISRGYGG